MDFATLQHDESDALGLPQLSFALRKAIDETSRSISIHRYAPPSIADVSFADGWQASTSESVPPALLARARTIAFEHKQLTEKLADGFDTRAAKKLGEYSAIVNALKEWDKAKEVSQSSGSVAGALSRCVCY